MFTLNEEFVAEYATKKPDWGFKSGPNSFGELVYYRTYSRQKPDGTQERWHDTVRRVVEGSYQAQEAHCLASGSQWDSEKAQRSAQEMYARMFDMKFMSGRALWALGTDYVRDRGSAALYNCAVTSSDHLADDLSWAMDQLMVGAGVGFTTSGAGTEIVGPDTRKRMIYQIPDSREGWVESVRLLVESYVDGGAWVDFDYSQIRGKGEPIKGFGGVASGPQPLMELHERLRRYLNSNMITERIIVDCFNAVGACVVAGNVRRSALLALGGSSDEFMDLKDYDKNPDRADIGWASNNSVVADGLTDEQFDDIARRIVNNGEPGVIWLEPSRMYGRMGEINPDPDVIGYNPCAEAQLNDKENCNLVDTFPSRHENLEDYLLTLKYAYLFAKSITLIDHHNPKTNEVNKRNRRIGTGMSGVVDAIAKFGASTIENWQRVGYLYLKGLDSQYSQWLDVPRSIRLTTVKPSGTLSKLAGTSAGVHYPVGDYVLRTIRVSDDSPIVDIFARAGYKVEDDLYSKATKVIYIPIEGKGLPVDSDMSVWDKVDLAAGMAENWADQAVSVTLTYREDEEHEIGDVLRELNGRVKTASFLKIDTNAYPQMPETKITKEEYEEMVAGIQPVDWTEFIGDGELEKFCNTDACEIPLLT